jgi:predicted nucleotidyltransferase
MRAMTVDPADSVAFLQRREVARQRKLDARFDAAWADFDQIVEMIVREFAPLRIWQWGSLLDRRHFSARSDIDIAVEGLGRAERLFELYARAEVLTVFPLHIVELERIEAEYAGLIRNAGRLVHGVR